MEFNPSEEIQDASKRPFSELELRVRYLKEKEHHRNFEEEEHHRNVWNLLNSVEITPKKIDELIDEEWKVTVSCSTISTCSLDKKLINLSYGLSPYDRDKTLFHEITHAVYGDPLGDAFGNRYRNDNRTIVEWLARKLRSDSELLKHVVLAFDFQPHVYDAVSYEAFSHRPIDFRNQLMFPFEEAKHYLVLERTLMD